MDADTILYVVILILLGLMAWVLWRIHRGLKEVKKAVDQLAPAIERFSDYLTIMLYLEVKDRPELLEKSPGLEQRALEAAERLGQKQLTAAEGPHG